MILELIDVVELAILSPPRAESFSEVRHTAGKGGVLVTVAVGYPSLRGS
jgi:hypothetical protein